MEARDTYDATYENESLRKFLADEPDDLPWMQTWLTMIRKAVGEGQRFTRVRVVSLPLTDYSRFGGWCAQLTNHDYWLFDSRKLVRMRFDDANVFLGAEIIEEPDEIVKHNYWRDASWHHAIRRDDFATEEHLRRV